VRRNVFDHLIPLLLILPLACTSLDGQRPPTGATTSVAVAAKSLSSQHCPQIVWQDYNTNRYLYQFDDNHRLIQCSAVEQMNSYNPYAFDQQLTYTSEGLLHEVRDEEDASRYHYRNGQLTFIDFFQQGQPIYRYKVTVNVRGQVVSLRGIPLNNSGLLGYMTRYQLDEQGRYVQLDMEDHQGKLYYRVIQRGFTPATGHLYELMQGIPYDLNRIPWLNWGEGFPISPYLASHIETYQYGAPQTPARLIKRADVSVTYQTDGKGHLVGQFSSDALTTIQDTVRINYQQCH